MSPFFETLGSGYKSKMTLLSWPSAPGRSWPPSFLTLRFATAHSPAGLPCVPALAVTADGGAPCGRPPGGEMNQSPLCRVVTQDVLSLSYLEDAGSEAQTSRGACPSFPGWRSRDCHPGVGGGTRCKASPITTTQTVTTRGSHLLPTGHAALRGRVATPPGAGARGQLRLAQAPDHAGLSPVPAPRGCSELSWGARPQKSSLPWMLQEPSLCSL